MQTQRSGTTARTITKCTEDPNLDNNKTSGDNGDQGIQVEYVPRGMTVQVCEPLSASNKRMVRIFLLLGGEHDGAIYCTFSLVFATRKIEESEGVYYSTAQSETTRTTPVLPHTTHANPCAAYAEEVSKEPSTSLHWSRYQDAERWYNYSSFSFTAARFAQLNLAPTSDCAGRSCLRPRDFHRTSNRHHRSIFRAITKISRYVGNTSTRKLRVDPRRQRCFPFETSITDTEIQPQWPLKPLRLPFSFTRFNT
ncbi:hypothetical protein GQ600_9347 [Phytophthora cactorum]|nr:hypothetical protein GQ600_9347 [Phytophthora cactorum]